MLLDVLVHKDGKTCNDNEDVCCLLRDLRRDSAIALFKDTASTHGRLLPSDL